MVVAFVVPMWFVPIESGHDRRYNVERGGEALDLDRVMGDPPATFEDPAQVIRHPHLLLEQKRDILRCWALEAQRRDATTTTATMMQGSSQLERVIDALIDLDQASSSALLGKGKTEKDCQTRTANRIRRHRRCSR